MKKITQEKYHIQESQEVISFPAGDNKAVRDRQDSMAKTNLKHILKMESC